MPSWLKPSLSTRLSGAGNWMAALFAIGVKLWLIGDDQIVAEKHDAYYYLFSAKHWYWGAPPDPLYYARQPMYALFVAMAHALGSPLRLATELTFTGACLALAGALRRLGFSRGTALAAFALLLFIPQQFSLFNRALADGFYAIALLLGVAFALPTALPDTSRRFRLAHAGAAGFFLMVAWNTRMENILILGLVTLWVPLTLWNQTSGRSLKEALLYTAAPMAAVIFLGTTTLKTVTYARLGYFATSTFDLAGYRALNRALMRIRPDRSGRYVLIPSQSLEKGYAVSPALRSLKGRLSHPAFQELQRLPYEPQRLGYAFLWVMLLTFHDTEIGAQPLLLDQRFAEAAGEINRALDRGELPSRPVYFSFLDPEPRNYLPYLVPSARKLLGWLVAPADVFLRSDLASDVPRAHRKIYDEMTARSGELPRGNELELRGWIALRSSDSLDKVAPHARVEWSGGPIEDVEYSEIPRPDVSAAYFKQGSFPLHRVRGFRIVMPRWDLLSVSQLVVSHPSTGEFRIALADIRPGYSRLLPDPELKTPARAPRIHFDDRIETSSPPSLRQRVKDGLRDYYQPLPKLLIVFGGAAAFLMLAGALRRKAFFTKRMTLLLIVVGYLTVSRFALFTFLEAALYEAQERYLFVIHPLILLLLAPLLAEGTALLESAGRLARQAHHR